MLRKELKENISNHIIRICSALFMSAGALYGLYTAEDPYEILVFVLFFGFFLGSMLGGLLGYILSRLYLLVFKIVSAHKKHGKTEDLKR